MKFKALLLMAMVVSLVSPSLHAEELPNDKRQTLGKHLIGDWIDTLDFDGKKTVALVRRRWSKDGQAYLADSVEPGNHSHEVGTWNGKEFVIHGLTSNGNTWVITFDTFDDNRWTGQGVGTWQGGPWTSEVSIDWTEQGFRYQDTTDGKPFVVTGRRQFAKSGAESAKALGQFMVGGVWTNTDDEGIERKHAYDWKFDGKFFSLTTIQDPEPSSTIQGVDVLTGLHHLWGFGIEGHGQGVSMQVSKNEWVFIGAGTTEDGPLVGTWRFIATDENTLTITAEASVNGEKQDPIHVVWKRVTEQLPHEAWLAYLKGTWEFEFEDGRKGTVKYAAAGKAQALTITGETEQFGIAGVIGWHPEGDKFVETAFAFEEGAQVHLHRDYTAVTEDRIIGVQKWWDSEIGPGGQTIEYRRVSDDKMTLSAKATESGGEDWIVRFTRK